MAQRFFALTSGWLAMRYARKHKHDGLGVIAIRCLRCAPLEFEQSPQGNRVPEDYQAAPPAAPIDSNIIRLADIQARHMDARE